MTPSALRCFSRHPIPPPPPIDLMIDERALVRWIASSPPETVIALRGDGYRCVLGAFLNETRGGLSREMVMQPDWYDRFGTRQAYVVNSSEMGIIHLEEGDCKTGAVRALTASERAIVAAVDHHGNTLGDLEVTAGSAMNILISVLGAERVEEMRAGDHAAAESVEESVVMV